MYSAQQLAQRHRKKKYLQKLALSCPSSERPLADLPYGWTEQLYAERLSRLVASRSAYGRGRNLENSAGYSLINSIINLLHETTYSPRDKVKILFNMTAQLINASEINSSELKSWAELTTNFNFEKEDTEHLADVIFKQLPPEQIHILCNKLYAEIKKDKDLMKELTDYFSVDFPADSTEGGPLV